MSESELFGAIEPTEQGVEVRRYEFDISGRQVGRRLDVYLAARFSEYSRTFIQALMKDKRITVNGKPVKASYSPCEGDHVVVLVPVRHYEAIPAEDIPLDIVYEDQWLVVVNKPPDLVVHPAKGHQTGTLVNALVHRFKHLSGLYGPQRPGIVHRLDRDTSGLILVIKDESVHEQVARQFEDRDVDKEYVAICEGRIELDGDLIDAPIGPDLRDRQKMTIRQSGGRPARTVYEVIERFRRFTIARCFPQTGRTHQIRLHLRYIGHPIVADVLYGHRDSLCLSNLTRREHLPEEEPLLDRQALHARRLTIYHPVLKREMTFEASVPADMMRLIEALREHDR
jgi:23S rRNA pseudouridine1911/1915/1917 synthase